VASAADVNADADQPQDQQDRNDTEQNCEPSGHANLLRSPRAYPEKESCSLKATALLSLAVPSTVDLRRCRIQCSLERIIESFGFNPLPPSKQRPSDSRPTTTGTSAGTHGTASSCGDVLPVL
jgi:hypothetical protein